MQKVQANSTREKSKILDSFWNTFTIRISTEFKRFGQFQHVLISVFFRNDSTKNYPTKLRKKLFCISVVFVSDYRNVQQSNLWRGE